MAWRANRKKKSGFTLMEVIISLAVLAVVIGPLLSLLFSGVRSSRLALETTLATYVAQMRIEEVYGLGDASITSLCGSGRQNESGLDMYYIRERVAFDDAGVDSAIGGVAARVRVSVFRSTDDVLLYVLEDVFAWQ